MAEEDILFGKNRHLFGGIEPSNMVTFDASFILNNGNKAVQLNCVLPNDTTIDGQLICSIGGATIRKSTTGYPKDEFDGEFVTNLETSGTFIDDTNITDGITYYSAFPYSKLGVYNRSNANRTNIEVGGYTYLFGFDLDESNDNPSTRVTYPNDVMNYNYNHMALVDANEDQNVGSWTMVGGEMFMPKPCVLKTNKSTKETSVLHYLNDNDYSKTVDGESSYVNVRGDDTYWYNAMMEWPKIYTKREKVGSIYKFRCSDRKIDDSWECYCNYDKNGNETDKFYTSIYPVVNGLSDNKNRPSSISEATPTSTSGKPPYSIGWDDTNINSTYRLPKIISTTYGKVWQTGNPAEVFLIIDLSIMVAKSTNLKDRLGMIASTYLLVSSVVDFTNGTLNDKGLFHGSGKLFGMEHFFTEWLLYPDSFYGTDVSGTNNVISYHMEYSSEKEPITVSLSAISGYVQNCELLPSSLGRFPKTVGATSTTYDCMYVYVQDSDTNYDDSRDLRMTIGAYTSGDPYLNVRYISDTSNMLHRFSYKEAAI